MQKYPSTHFLKDVFSSINYLRDNKGLEKTKFKFIGTIKLDGTNAALVKNEDGSIEVQSRRMKLNAENDNYGCYMFFEKIGLDFIDQHIFKPVEDLLSSKNALKYPLEVFGEFAGKSVNSKKAVHKADDFFSIFAIHFGPIEENTQNWISLENFPGSSLLNEKRIFNSLNYPVFMLEIDIEKPQLAQSSIESLTEEVSQACPAGDFFGVEGPGEGIVWTCLEPGFENQRFWFKSKGKESQQRASKTENSLKTIEFENMQHIAEEFLVESRFLRAIEFLKECNLAIEKQNIKPFVEFLIEDVLKEYPRVLEKDSQDVLKKIISRKGATWFLKHKDTSC